jgi:serine/threonine-protein kinase
MADRSATPDYADPARRYRLDARIAGGGMGEVWRAGDTLLDRPVAVKLLRQEHADDPVFRARFETEARHAAGLHHPGIAQVYDVGVGDADHRPYLVMEYVPGRPLSELLRSGEAMDPQAAVVLLAEAGDALGAAHAAGIVHRDVKPANLIVTDERHVKVTDFGIARAADAVALTRTGEVLGTPQYLSPEQAEGRPATPASDVYALGAVAFECLAGRRPYVADSPVATALAHVREPIPDLPPSTPPGLAAVVRRALAKDPAQRYGDGAAFAVALRGALVEVTPVAGTDAAAGPETSPPTRVLTAPVAAAVPASSTDQWRQRARRVPGPVWAVAGVFLVIVVVAAIANLDDGGGGSGGTTPVHTPGRSPSLPSHPRSPARHTASSPATSSSAATATPGHGNGPGHGHGKGHHGHHGKGDQ